jgi:hypothetical protein
MAEKKKKDKKKWIPSDLKEGAFTKKAKAHGMTVSQYADEVLKKDSKATETTKRQARLAKTFKKMAKKKK